MSGSKFETQREKTYGGKWSSSEAYSVSISCDALNCVESQALIPKASQQHPVQLQQSSTQKPLPPSANATTTPTDRIITMSSQRKQSTSPSLQRSNEMEKAEASQTFYSSDYNSQTTSS